MSMDCKTCRGEGFVSFEAGAVVKRCPKCNGTGSSKFNAICEHIVSPLTKELAELRTDNQRLEGLLQRVQVAMSLDDTEWGYSGTEKYTLLADIKAALSTANDEVTE